jgi:hypothetical protein
MDLATWLAAAALLHADLVSALNASNVFSRV